MRTHHPLCHLPILGLFLAIAAAIPFTRAAAPPIDPPVPAGGDASAGPAPGNQGHAWISAGGPGFLAVWTDSRTTLPTHDLGTETGDDVYARLLDATGQPIGETSFLVSGAWAHQREPRAAWNGSAWLVVWKDLKPSGADQVQHVFGIRFGADGAPLDPEPFPILSPVGYEVEVTARGSEWLVVSGETGILGARVSANGDVVDDPPQELVPEGTRILADVSVHAAGNEYLLVHSKSSDPVGQRFTADLAPIGGTIDLPGAAVASSDERYYVAWRETDGTLVGSPMSVEGVLDFPGGVFVTDDVSTRFMVRWGGTQWWILYAQPVEEIKLARVEVDGTVLDPGGFPLYDDPPTDIQHEHVSDGMDGSVVVAWTQYDTPGSSPNDLKGSHVSGPGTSTPAVDVATSAPMQLKPDLVAGPGHFLLAHRSEMSGLRRLDLRRLDGLGQPIDDTSVAVAESPSLGPHAAAWNGSVYLVVWSDDRTIYGRRFDATLDPLDAAPFRVMDGTSPDVAALDSDFLVVATQQTSHAYYYVAHGIRVGGDGSLLDSEEFPIGANYSRVPRVLPVGDRWLAVWQRNYSWDDTMGEINAAWVERDGTAQPYFFVSHAYEPELAYSGARALMVFRKGSEATAQHDIGARIILPDGSMPESEFIVSEAADRQRAPHVAWDGKQFLIAWEDKRDALHHSDERSDVFAARVSEDGSVVDPDGFSVARGEDSHVQPFVASADGDSLIAIASFERPQGVTAYRLGTHHLEGTATNPPQADFTTDRTYGCAPLDVAFTDASTGDVSEWEWTFGDGGSATEQHPQHTFSNEGTYTVSLTARDGHGADTEVKEHLVTASGGVAAAFSSSVVSGCAPLEVDFEDRSAGFPREWTWNFGDDGFSNQQDPTHIYEYPGSFNVMLTASGCGTSTETKLTWIEVSEMCPYTSLTEGETTIYGSTTNGHTATHGDDGFNQIVWEESFGSYPDHSHRVEQRWFFTLVTGASHTFHAELFADAVSFETLGFEYSADGETFFPLATVDTSGHHSIDAPLPPDLVGEVTIRLVDYDREVGDTHRNSVNVDHLRIDTRQGSPGRDCEAVTGLSFVNRERLEWNAAASSTHYDLVRGNVATLRVNDGIGDGSCQDDDVETTGIDDQEIPLPGEAFYYVVRGDADTFSAGTYDNPPGTAAIHENRDEEAGSTSGSECADRP
jgi:PKD repeat protein